MLGRSGKEEKVTIIQVDPEKVKDNPYQPRRSYSPNKVGELASSIEQNGLLETPVGRRTNGDVELAFGHMRKRSFLKLKKKNAKKWPTMPVDIRELTDQDMVVFALEENLKRSDITPIDLARSVSQYLDVFPEVSETSLATKLSMTQGHVSNMRRVMRLPVEILQKIDEGRITFTMARELLILENLTAPGKESRYSNKAGGYVDTPKDSLWLMRQAIKAIVAPGKEGTYGMHPCTVDGMQKAIHSTVKGEFKPLGTSSDYGYQNEEVLFDVQKAGCKSCESVLKTHPTKSQVCSWCTNVKCWEKKQKAHREQKAAAAKKKMEADILAKAAASEAVRQAKPISQEIHAEETYRIQHRSTNKFWDGTAVSPEEACQKAGWPLDECWVRVETPIVDDPSAESGHRGSGWANVTSKEAKDIVDSIPEDEREQAKKRIAQLGKEWPDYPCLTCLNVGHCDGTGVHAVDGAGKETKFACDDHMGKTDAKKVREKATLTVPKEVLELATEKAGSRAEILDLNELRSGSYGDLKTGYVQLDSIMDRLDNPQECLETCTRGFHYAFDSKPRPSWDRDREEKVLHVCTDPKCVTKKKTAFTRALNAAGQAKKKAEYAAIKQAVDATTALDHPRMKVLVYSLLSTDRSYYSSENSAVDWWTKKLKIDAKEHAESSKLQAKIIEKLDACSGEELARHILEYSLMKMAYTGDVQRYKVQTTGVLNWLGVGVQVPKKEA